MYNLSAMSKTLVTHINPHLDDIVAIWLLKKFDPDFKKSKVEFISATRDLAEKEENKFKVYVGTGGGQFDEHKEGLTTCAGSLVHEYLKEKGYLPKDEITIKALERLVEWNKLIDTGKAPASVFDEFSVQAFLRCKDSTCESSESSLELGMKILDRILGVLKRKQQAILDFEKRVEFETKFGKTIAIKSDAINREFCREQKGDLFLMYHPKYKSVQFFTPSFEIDLEPLYAKLKSLDPEASWFLHQSHHMVLCGSASAPESKPTKLSFEQLIEAVKTI